jgi:hypothetical protein
MPCCGFTDAHQAATQAEPASSVPSAFPTPSPLYGEAKRYYTYEELRTDPLKKPPMEVREPLAGALLLSLQ